jgi:hypothetical protein
MVHDNYLVLFSTLCCPLDAGFHFMRKCYRGTRSTLRTENSSQEMKKTLH